MLSLIYLVLMMFGIYAMHAHWADIIIVGTFIIAGYVLAIRDYPEILDK